MTSRPVFHVVLHRDQEALLTEDRATVKRETRCFICNGTPVRFNGHRLRRSDGFVPRLRLAGICHRCPGPSDEEGKEMLAPFRYAWSLSIDDIIDDLEVRSVMES